MSFLKFKLFLLFLIVISFPAYADFVIKNYEVNVNINKDSTLFVSEKLHVDFNSPMHGIYRTIPLNFQGCKLYLYNVSVPGYDKKVYNDNGALVIRVGSPSQLVTGEKNYEIDYAAQGDINFFADHSEFYWNLIGTEWRVPIQQGSFTIMLPEDLRLDASDYYVYTGLSGQKGENASYHFDGRSLSGALRQPLNPYEGVTAAIKFPPGFLEQQRPFFRLKLWLNDTVMENLWVAVLPLIAIALLFGYTQSLPQTEKLPDMVFYKLPEDISPAVAGVVEDNRDNNRDLISLIYDWAAKGYITIQEIEKNELLGLIHQKDYLVKKVTNLPYPKDFEATIFFGLFGQGDEVTVSSLQNKFYKTLNKARTQLDNYINNKTPFYVKSSRLAAKYLQTGSLVLLVLVILLFSSSANFLPILVSVMVTSGILFVSSFFIARRTAAGMKEYQILNGFKEFVNRAEKPKLEALLKEDPNYFDKTLAFAVAFGISNVWAAKFQNLLTQPPSWYAGSYAGAFSMNNFCNSLNQSVSTMTSAFSSSPGGGGGGAGGGGGGGGGGGW